MSKELGLVLDGRGYDYAKTVLSYYLWEGGQKAAKKYWNFNENDK